MPTRLLTILAIALLTVTLLVGCGQEPSSLDIPETPPASSPDLTASEPEMTTSPEPEASTTDDSSESTSSPVVLAAPSTLTILSISVGDVFVLRPGSEEWAKVEVGMSLEVGDSVKSGDNSKAEITFFDGSTIDLEAGTQIKVAALDIAADTGSTTILLEQEVGKTISRVTKLADPASRYEVETPTGIAAVRGSTMMVEVIDGNTWVTNLGGHIWVIANGVELEVPVGRTCLVILGGNPQLLPASGGTYGGGSTTKTVENPYITISEVVSNDDGSQLDPGEQGTWQIVSGDPVWQGARHSVDVAGTLITGVEDEAVTFSIDNGYPGYCGSAGLIIENTGGAAMEVTGVSVIISTPAGGSAIDISVTCTGALDEANPEVIGAGAKAVGGVHFCIEQSALPGSIYTVEVVFNFSQSL
jgi:hypothetical protein